ncbi:MAG: PEP/pyruvate-binding domain-containing protein [Gemmatimonadales bacterium]
MTPPSRPQTIPAFDRRFFSSGELCTGIGDGALGGKAQGLLAVRDVVKELGARSSDITVTIPRMIVVTTSVFDAFMSRNHLVERAASDLSDDRMAHAFQQGSLPTEVVGDLRALIDEVHAPLAVRSSSLLEDAMHRPFAGVYETKMIPNNQPDADSRFHRLVEAIKLVWASTFFRSAKSYRRAAGLVDHEEQMAVLIQEVVGRRFGDRFYPTLSGVAKSYNFYPSGQTRPEDGVVNLALGLGKTIVDGGRSWVYSPALPAVSPPYGSSTELLDNSQVQFWAVNMGKPPAFDPVAETEYLVQASLADAEYDGTLRFVASTYDPASDRMSPGVGRSGPRAVDFAPLLKLRELPLNDIVKDMLQQCRETFGTAVEIEFALSLDETATGVAQLGFLQVRPMVVSEEKVDIADDEWSATTVTIASERALGNGTDESICDIVYVKPESFEARATRQIASELAQINEGLVAASRPYLLIGFGRWGSSDPWLGIPVEWGDVAGARVIVEATLPTMNVEASQGAHFFHNISSFQVKYLTVHHELGRRIDWPWLGSLATVSESAHVRHARSAEPLLVKVDGRTARGAVWRSD